jgi:hypothetical protein
VLGHMHEQRRKQAGVKNYMEGGESLQKVRYG